MLLCNREDRSYYFTRKWTDFHKVFYNERVWRILNEEKQRMEVMQITTSASTNINGEWHRIDWPSVYKNIKSLQARIVKAIKQGRRGKVKALQYLLSHSFSGRALAVRRVIENRGKRTPGVDAYSTPCH